MTADLCPICLFPKCHGTTPSHPHHGLCCLDGPRRACWGTPAGVLDRIMREDRADQQTTRERDEP